MGIVGLTVGKIIGIGYGTGSGSGTSAGDVCAGVVLGLGVRMTDGALGIACCSILAMYSILLIVVS